LLGCGHYGKVYYGTVRCKKTGRLLPVAVKVAKFETNQSDDDEEEINNRRKTTIECQIEALRIELNILAYIQCLNERQHPNIVRLIGTTTDEYNQLYIMTEYCEYGNLECYVQQKYKNRQFIDEIVLKRSKQNSHSSVFPIVCYGNFNFNEKS
jgi:serine/threonine protein kinase